MDLTPTPRLPQVPAHQPLERRGFGLPWVTLHANRSGAPRRQSGPTMGQHFGIGHKCGNVPSEDIESGLSHSAIERDKGRISERG